MPQPSIICNSSHTIQPVTSDTVDECLDFVNHARADIFPDRSLVPNTRNLFGSGSSFLEARDGNKLIGIIGYIPYDHRHSQISCKEVWTVEVVRLYVTAQYRRCGLAGALFSALRDDALQDGIECLYLHSPPFLPGVIQFWQRWGFIIILKEDDPVWQTTHMKLVLKENE
ncbi:N-acetyltransferase GCN5 [Phaeosphaeriaceae sp. PMI808]|nr:N-acetyltransferase GCN5 [Phaeosphaeriaceae sp. PMI808]